MNCDDFLKLLALASGTWFWLWYLVWEYEHFLSGGRHWWERDIKDLFRRKK